MYTKQLRGHMSWKETSIFSRYEHILTHARHHMMSKQFSVYARARYQATAVSNKYIRVFLLWFPLALKHFVYALQREVYDGSLDVGVRLIFQFVWKDELNSYWNESIGRARAQYFFSIPFARSCQQKKKEKTTTNSPSQVRTQATRVSIVTYFFVIVSFLFGFCRLLLHTLYFPLCVQCTWTLNLDKIKIITIFYWAMEERSVWISMQMPYTFGTCAWISLH